MGGPRTFEAPSRFTPLPPQSGSYPALVSSDVHRTTDNTIGGVTVTTCHDCCRSSSFSPLLTRKPCSAIHLLPQPLPSGGTNTEIPRCWSTVELMPCSVFCCSGYFETFLCNSFFVPSLRWNKHRDTTMLVYGRAHAMFSVWLFRVF